MVGSDDTGATTSYATAPEKQGEGRMSSPSEGSIGQCKIKCGVISNRWRYLS